MIAVIIIIAWVAVLPARAQDTEPPAITAQNADALTLTRTLAGHDFAVNDIAFTPDGGALASASDDITARLWDVDTGETLWTLNGQLVQVRSIAIAPDGDTVLTTGFNARAVLWNIPAQTLMETITLPAALNDGVFAPDGDTFAVASGDGTVRIYPLTMVQGGAPDALQTLTADVLRVQALAYSPDGAQIAAALGFPAETVQVWDVASGEAVQSLAGHDGDVFSVRYNPDGETLLTGGGDGAVIVWDAATGDPRYTIADAHDGDVFDVAFSPDGALVASVGFDGVLRLWDAATGDPLAAYTPGDETRSLAAVAFSPDGARLAAAGEAGVVYLWQP